MSEPSAPPVDRDSDDFKLRLYRQAVMALAKANGGTLKVDRFMEITNEKGYLLNRALPGGGWEFKYVSESVGGHA